MPQVVRGKCPRVQPMLAAGVHGSCTSFFESWHVLLYKLACRLVGWGWCKSLKNNILFAACSVSSGRPRLIIRLLFLLRYTSGIARSFC